MPGISNVTLRIRYYGLYCWLADTYGRLGLTNDPTEWRRWVLRTEALYALAVVASGGESGVAGVDWAGTALEKSKADEIVDFQAATETKGSDLYLRNALGSSGAPIRASSSKWASSRCTLTTDYCNADFETVGWG